MKRGRPAAVRCNNGPEFTNARIKEWCAARKIDLASIDPGRPMQNRRVESDRRFRDECLKMSRFRTLTEPPENVSNNG